MVGFAGVVTLGHAAYFGVGAYTAGMVSAHLGWTEPISALLLAGFVAAIVGFISGAVLLRYHGLTLLMLTLATAICLQEFANVNEDVTGGFDGLTGVSFAPLLGLFEYDLWGHTYYWYSLAVLIQRLCNAGCFEFCSLRHDPNNPNSRRRRSTVRCLCRCGGLSGTRG